MGSQIGFEKLASVSWYYVASLLIIGLYFKFNRFWSIRNLDLILIVLLAPGALMVTHGQKLRSEYYDAHVEQMADFRMPADDARQTSIADPSGSLLANPESANQENQAPPRDSKSPDSKGEPDSQGEKKSSSNQSSPVRERVDRAELLVELRQQRPADSPFMEDPEFAFNVRLERNGYLWLFGFGLLLLIRILLDPGFRRRPMLESNLSVGGLVFLGCSMLAFVIIDVAQSQPVSDSTDGARHMVKMVNREAVDGEEGEIYYQHGPGFALMHIFPAIPTFVSASGEFKVPESDSDEAGSGRQLEITTKILAIISLLGIVAGIVLIGYWHFGNFHLGVTVATLYLMLPFTADTAGLVFHVLPALLIVWAIVIYKRPYLSGFLIGLAAGVFYYPLFLLPLWFSFYWERGRVRFLLGFLVSVLLVIGSLVFVSRDFAHFTYHLQRIFGFWLPKVVGVRGVWAVGWDPWFRLPLLAGFFGLSFSFALWPIRKDLGVLISCTAAVMMALQFCHGFGGGMYIAWYLPLFLLTVFRPSLEDRVAINDINEKWFIKNLTATK